MTTIGELSQFLEEFAPSHLAEDWDNVGLLVGAPARPVERVMTCLTVTPASADEALREGAGLIVSHHPFPFKPLRRLTTETLTGRLLLQLTAAQIAVYSPHTAFDSAAQGINQKLAERLGLSHIRPLVVSDEAADGLGSGRYGKLAEPVPLPQFADLVKQQLQLGGLHAVGSPQLAVANVAVACGAAGQFLASARAAGCEALVVGETNFHTCLEAEALGMGLVLPGHFASERFAVEQLAGILQSRFNELRVWASRDESDPLWWC